MTITPTEFNVFLPALRTPGDEVYYKMQAALDRACGMSHAKEYEIYCTDDNGLTPSLERYVCVTAAYEELPALDLVATPTGFGVVSNQNTAPASRDRVAAYREQLRIERTTVWEELVQGLFLTSWASSASGRSLIFCDLYYAPYIFRRHGVRDEGRDVYIEEMLHLQPALHLAQDYLESIISPDLYVRLSLLQSCEKSLDPTLCLAIERSRRVMAAHMQHRPPRDIQKLSRSLLDLLRSHKEMFPEYTSSAEYAAQTAEPYRNDRDHPTFFFS